MNVRVVFGKKPIRAIAVQCARCDRWFSGYDITSDKLETETNIACAQFICPVCGAVFSAPEYGCMCGINVKEYDRPQDVYDGCFQKVEKWEQICKESRGD